MHMTVQRTTLVLMEARPAHLTGNLPLTSMTLEVLQPQALMIDVNAHFKMLDQVSPSIARLACLCASPAGFAKFPVADLHNWGWLC